MHQKTCPLKSLHSSAPTDAHNIIPFDMFIFSRKSFRTHYSKPPLFVHKVSEGKMSEGKLSEGKVSEGKVFKGKVYEGKVYEGKVSEGKVSERKVSEGIVFLFEFLDKN